MHSISHAVQAHRCIYGIESCAVSVSDLYIVDGIRHAHLLQWKQRFVMLASAGVFLSARENHFHTNSVYRARTPRPVFEFLLLFLHLHTAK